MIIPKSFKMLGHTIKPKIDNKTTDAKNALGYCHPSHNEILLADESDGRKLPLTVVEHTYCHELVHYILKCMGEEELYKNEKFVDVFGGLLHQYLTTTKF